MKTNNEKDDSFSTFLGREITLFKIYIKSKVKNVLWTLFWLRFPTLFDDANKENMTKIDWANRASFEMGQEWPYSHEYFIASCEGDQSSARQHY